MKRLIAAIGLAAAMCIGFGVSAAFAQDDGGGGDGGGNEFSLAIPALTLDSTFDLTLGVDTAAMPHDSIDPIVFVAGISNVDHPNIPNCYIGIDSSVACETLTLTAIYPPDGLVCSNSWDGVTRNDPPPNRPNFPGAPAYERRCS